MRPDASCLDCGLPYEQFPLDVLLPRAQWLLIHPTDHGLLCAACIVKRAAALPGCTVVHATLEMAPQPCRRCGAMRRPCLDAVSRPSPSCALDLIRLTTKS